MLEVELDHRRLKRICKLDPFTQLQKASFCDNELTEIQGLETVTELRELCLESNRSVCFGWLSVFPFARLCYQYLSNYLINIYANCPEYRPSVGSTI